MSALSDDLRGLLFGDVYLNPHFFKKGLLVVSTKEVFSQSPASDIKSFQINGREFLFHKPGRDKGIIRPQPPARSIKKALNILHPLIHYANNRDEFITGADEKSPLLFNKNRHDELFLPLTFGQDASKQGLYVYPWTSGRNTLTTTFSGFRQYISAGCLMGAAMQGVTGDGERVSLINHQLALKPLQRIESIAFDKASGNPFEQVLFSEFEKHCLLIKSLSSHAHNPQLLYHLPAPDYLLFGLKLLINNQISPSALEKFVSTVSEHQLHHRAKLSETAARHAVEITFSSPFRSLFADYPDIHSVFSLLEEASIDVSKSPEDAESRFVAYCLSRLVAGDGTLAAAWKSFLSARSTSPDTLEDLFRLGNAVLIASGAWGHAGHEVCSLLPLSEKQIQVHYDTLRKSKTCHSSLPAIINLTTFEPVVSFSPSTNGLLFYFADPSGTLSTLLNETGILSKAARNIGFFAKKSSTKTSSDAGVNDAPEKLEALLS